MRSAIAKVSIRGRHPLADARGKETTVSVKAGPFPPCQHEYRVMPQGWVDLAPVTTASPLWRAIPRSCSRRTISEDSNLCTPTFRGVADTHDETLAQSGDRVMELAEIEECAALVIDVRTNTGGKQFSRIAATLRGHSEIRLQRGPTACS
jgi:hypothetical protein